MRLLATRLAVGQSIERQFIKSAPINVMINWFSKPSSGIHELLKLFALKKDFTARELRDAYFDAAKRCHPDTQKQSSTKTHSAAPIDEDAQKAASSNLFLEITESYEALQEFAASGRKVDSASSIIDEKNLIIKSEEQDYREAVKETLGIDADILEESKRCPMFRLWLKGGSHMAFHYNIFLMRHGGLAQMLPEKQVGKITEGTSTRRRRKR